MGANGWGPGYTRTELDRAQERFGLSFPPDLLALLLQRRPPGGHDWNDEADIRQALSWPFKGLLFDVENNHLWWPEWGDRPVIPRDRTEVLRGVLARAPQLIPLIAHRYLPETPNEAGNPVFSVYQSDVVYYGSDLQNYFHRELEDARAPWREPLKRIDFWSDLVERNGYLAKE